MIEDCLEDTRESVKRNAQQSGRNISIAKQCCPKLWCWHKEMRDLSKNKHNTTKRGKLYWYLWFEKYDPKSNTASETVGDWGRGGGGGMHRRPNRIHFLQAAMILTAKFWTRKTWQEWLLSKNIRIIITWKTTFARGLTTELFVWTYTNSSPTPFALANHPFLPPKEYLEVKTTHFFQFQLYLETYTVFVKTNVQQIRSYPRPWVIMSTKIGPLCVLVRGLFPLTQFRAETFESRVYYRTRFEKQGVFVC